MTRRGPATFAIFLACCGPAYAHGDGDTAPLIWTFDPWVVLPLGTVILLFAIGTIRLGQPEKSKWRTLLFAEGATALAVALVSPLHWLGEHSLTFHMIEHETVMLVAAPLIALARPIARILWALPRELRRAIGRALKHPVVTYGWNWCTRATQATVIHGIAIWLWHVPLLFDAAVTHIAIHRLQHLSFFLTAFLFWWAILWKSDYGTSSWHLFVTMIHTSILGALMALAPHVLYLAQPETAVVAHFDPLQDQQLAGLVMWIPGGTVYAVAALLMMAAWIQNSSRGLTRDVQ